MLMLTLQRLNVHLQIKGLVAAAVASPCRQGAPFSPAVVSPDVESSGVVQVPGVMSLAQCVAACCDLPGYDLAWLFEGRCYILSCQQRANCRPRERPGADSLVLQSLVRGEPFGGRWRPPPQSFEVPESLQGRARARAEERPDPGPGPGGSRSPVEPDTPTHVRDERMITYRT